MVFVNLVLSFAQLVKVSSWRLIKLKVFALVCDGIGIGIGFTLALTLLGAMREFLGTGAIFGFTLQGENYGMLLFVLAPGAFIALGYLIAAVNKLRKA